MKIICLLNAAVTYNEDELRMTTYAHGEFEVHHRGRPGN